MVPVGSGRSNPNIGPHPGTLDSCFLLGWVSETADIKMEAERERGCLLLLPALGCVIKFLPCLSSLQRLFPLLVPGTSFCFWFLGSSCWFWVFGPLVAIHPTIFHEKSFEPSELGFLCVFLFLLELGLAGGTTAVPKLFGTKDLFWGRQFFRGPGWGREGLGMIQVRYIYCAFCSCYLFILKLLAALGLSYCTWASPVVVSGGYSSLPCSGFSLWLLWLLQSLGSRSKGLSSCGFWVLVG